MGPLLRCVGFAASISVATFSAAGHPPDQAGRHDEFPMPHADPSSSRVWTNLITGEIVRGSFLATRAGRVSIERDSGDVVIFTVAELTPSDQAEVQSRLEHIKAVNESPAALIASSEPLAFRPEKPPQAVPFECFAPSVKTRWDDRWLYVESDGLPHAPLAHTLMVGITSWQQQVPLPQHYTDSNAWQIPLRPELAEKPISARTQLYRGAIALAANGVPIFNALNNRGDDTLKAGELDDFGGHSGRGDDYHYHIAPLALQKVVGKDQPIAYALDGFALYGLFDPAAKTGQASACPLGARERLDEFNGHFAPNPDGTRGQYHYHASVGYPYINGGMRGKVTVKDDQIDPQPRVTPIRPAGQPLRGAHILGFQALNDRAWSLEYTRGGKKDVLAYRIEPNGTYVFDFPGPDGRPKTETYIKRDDRPSGPGGGGRDRPDAPPPPPDGPEGDRPPPRPQTRPQTHPQTRPDAAPADAEPQFKHLDGFTLSSPAIGDDHRLPAEFTCDGASHSPPLSWSKPPQGTKSLALVMHHTPGPGDTHVYWVLYNIPTDVLTLPTNATGVGVLGINTVNERKEYAPPCSKGPGDKTYTLTLYAMSVEPKVEAGRKGVSRENLLAAIKDCVIASAKLDVVYARPAGSDRKQPPPK